MLRWFLLLVQIGEAAGNLAVFAKYPNKYFIETGTQAGVGVQMALDAGFSEILSVELCPKHYADCCSRFQSRSNVKLFLGDSTDVLPKMLELIDAPATFWLDGHYSWNGSARGKTNSPILAELESIKHHSIKTHTIMIDDVRQFGTIEFDFVELEEIVDKIMEINPKYQITFEDCAVRGDILVAWIQESK